jgi:hypothetical protein
MDFMHILKEAGAAEAASTLDTLLLELNPTQLSTKSRVNFARLGRLVRPALLPGLSGQGVGFSDPRFAQVDVLARIGFLLALDTMAGPSSVELITVLYRTGSSREQASVMRALPWFPEPERFIELAEEAARTNDVDVFAALCLDSPFPTRVLPDDALFQVVMKAMFLSLDAAQIVDLRRRVTPELKRMAADFRREREAAGRVVPNGVLFIESTP